MSEGQYIEMPEKSKILIRHMIHDDIEAVVRLGDEMHKESAYSYLSYSADKCRMLAMALMKSVRGFAVVAEIDCEIIGMMGASVTDFFFSEDLMAWDYLLYVKPECRGTSAAARLIARYVAWAKSQDAKMITLGTSSGVYMERTAELYEHFKFRKAGILTRLEELKR